MREIKFRGKNADGKWLYGNLVKYNYCNYSIVSAEEMGDAALDRVGILLIHNTVDECTIGQFTGMYDKYGKEIYEGDIVKAWNCGSTTEGYVRAREDGLWVFYPAWQGRVFWKFQPDANGRDFVEVLGNIYEKNGQLNGGDVMSEHLREGTKMYAARDSDGSLWLYFGKKPCKDELFWVAFGDYCETGEYLPEVKWTDEEPTEVVYDEVTKKLKVK